MKAQRTTTPTTIIRRQVATALSRLFDVVTLLFGLVLAGGGLAVIITTPADDDLAPLLACVAIPSGLVLLTAVVGGQVWRHGVLAVVAVTCRVLLVVAAGLALLGIWADVPTPVPSWRQDVMGWQALGVLTLLLGLAELPGLHFLPGAGAAWRRELIGLQVLIAWLPFSWLLLFYPAAPVWAGRRDGVHQVLPELLCLAVIAGTCILQILTRLVWQTLAAREIAAAVLAAAPDDDTEELPALIPVRVWLLEDGDEPLGVDLGRLPEIYGDWITQDLPAALWSIPTGVVVRVGYTGPSNKRYVVDGSITDFRDGGVVVDGWWIGGEDIDLTGLVILDDRRSPLSCAHTRTPLLLPAQRPGQPDPAVGAVTSATVTPDEVSGADSGQDSGADSAEASSADSAQPGSGHQGGTDPCGASLLLDALSLKDPEINEVIQNVSVGAKFRGRDPQ